MKNNMTKEEAQEEITKLQNYIKQLPMNNIKNYVEENKVLKYSYAKVEMVENLILIPLPNANTNWTLESFEWAIKFLKLFPNTYIEHSNNHIIKHSMCENYLTIVCHN